jgi:tRNA nucleotidyltransferase/poly(A) polymerase
MPDSASSIEFPDIVREIESQIPESTGAYLVGGAVRDALLGRPVHDIDIALPGDGVAAARRVAHALGGACYPLDAERGVGRVITARGASRFTIDFAALRGGDISADLAGRDFTINAIAIPLHHWDQPLDPMAGAADLLRRQIRACSGSSIEEDPVRSIRAVRLAAQLEFQMEPATREQVRAGAPGLARVSAERIRDEFFRILSGRKTAAAIRVSHALGLLGFIVPETIGMENIPQTAPHFFNGWDQTTLALEKLEVLVNGFTNVPNTNFGNDLSLGLARVQLGRFHGAIAERLARPLADDRALRGLLFFAALLHDIGKSGCHAEETSQSPDFPGHEQRGADAALQRAIALRLSNEETAFVVALIRHQQRPRLLPQTEPVTRRSIFRYFRATGPAGFETCLLALADTMATYGPTLPLEIWQGLVQTVRTLWEGYFEHASEMVYPIPLLTGNDLIRDYQMTPGPAIGELLDALREAQAAGEVQTREGAHALIARGLGRA